MLYITHERRFFVNLVRQTLTYLLERGQPVLVKALKTGVRRAYVTGQNLTVGDVLQNYPGTLLAGRFRPYDGEVISLAAAACLEAETDDPEVIHLRQFLLLSVGRKRLDDGNYVGVLELVEEHCQNDRHFLLDLTYPTARTCLIETGWSDLTRRALALLPAETREGLLNVTLKEDVDPLSSLGQTILHEMVNDTARLDALTTVQQRCRQQSGGCSPGRLDRVVSQARAACARRRLSGQAPATEDY